MNSQNLYSFDDNKGEFSIYKPDIPSPWINYLSNGSLHAFISQVGGGLCWWKHPAVFRLTRYRSYNLPTDSPGFYLYIREKEGDVWSPAFRPTEAILDEWKAVHAPGRTSFYACKNDIAVELTMFVAPDSDTLVWDMTIKNQRNFSVDLDIFSYVELYLHQWFLEFAYGYYFRFQQKTWFDEELQSLLYLYHFDGHPRKNDIPLVYFTSSLPITGYDGDRDKFIGNYRFEKNPIAVERGTCSNSSSQGGESCAALQGKVKLEAGELKQVQYFFGATKGALDDFGNAVEQTKKTIEWLSKEGNVEQQKEKLNLWWKEHLEIFNCTIPDKDAQREINIWNPIQCVHTARYIIMQISIRYRSYR